MEARRRAPLVGRDAELGELERRLSAAQATHGGAALILGEAGLGKSRLADELAHRARDGGFDVLVGRAIDLVGAELPFQPFVEAFPPLGELRRSDGPAGPLHVFERTLALVAECSRTAPTLIVLEDLHWADLSTLDLLLVLAHHVGGLRVLVVATARADEPASAAQIRRLADGVRRAGSTVVVELGPLADDAVEALLTAQATGQRADVLGAIVRRSEGNPFFAEELLAAAAERPHDLPHDLQQLLLSRVARLDDATQDLLRLVAAAGRDVGYELLRDLSANSEETLRLSLRSGVEHGVLVADQARGSFRFRHALLAEAVYRTILPGEREELHGRLAEELVRCGAAGAAELAPHWAAARRHPEALAASVQAASEAEAAAGLSEALAHLERAVALWELVEDAAGIAGSDLAGLCSDAAELASKTGAPPRAVELGRRAIELAGTDDGSRAARLHVRLGEYLHETGHTDDVLAAMSRAVELAPAEPPVAERAFALASLAGGFMITCRYAESLAVATDALALARRVGASDAEVRALTVVGLDLAYLGEGDEGVAAVRQALQLAERVGDRVGTDRAYVCVTDVLTMLGRVRESAELAAAGLEALRRWGVDSALLRANRAEALLALGDWDEAERLSAPEGHGISASYPYWLLTIRADVQIARGDLGAARAHLEAAAATLPPDRAMGQYDASLAELAVWQGRWTDAEACAAEGLRRAAAQETGVVRLRLCAAGLRAQAELIALARARRDAAVVDDRLARAGQLLAAAHRVADRAAAVTPVAEAWLALAEAEHERARGVARPDLWVRAAQAWDGLDRPFLAACCRWRQAETLVAAGASRPQASSPLRDAHAVATRLGARALVRQLEQLAERARLDPTPLEPPGASAGGDVAAALGLTARELEVLALVARGLTNREIAETLVISAKTASAHISHILRKLDAPNRREAAAIAQRAALAHDPLS